MQACARRFRSKSTLFRIGPGDYGFLPGPLTALKRAAKFGRAS